MLVVSLIASAAGAAWLSIVPGPGGFAVVVPVGPWAQLDVNVWRPHPDIHVQLWFQNPRTRFIHHLRGVALPRWLALLGLVGLCAGLIGVLEPIPFK